MQKAAPKGAASRFLQTLVCPTCFNERYSVILINLIENNCSFNADHEGARGRQAGLVGGRGAIMVYCWDFSCLGLGLPEP